jgi:serine/threonine-protein kinase SRPK3
MFALHSTPSPLFVFQHTFRTLNSFPTQLLRVSFGSQTSKHPIFRTYQPQPLLALVRISKPVMSNRSATSVSPSSQIDDDPRHEPGSGLVIEDAPWGLEKVFDYETGGHHPVHLGDVLNDRYRVIHKFGSGGYANVWLCCDQSANSPTYVATKIIMAEGSTSECPESRVVKVVDSGCDREPTNIYLSLPLDQFTVGGPNGLHYAFVYPVLGPRVSRLLRIASQQDPGPALRSICRETTQAMATLHMHDICHGDFRPANILVRISGLDGLPEDAVLKLLGRPRTTRVLTASGEPHQLDIAPKYLVYPVDWDDVLSRDDGAQLTVGSACVTDFGESYDASSPPDEVGIPQVYCSPEQCLERRIGKESDLWALGCTLFEIRTGQKLFDTFDDDMDEYLAKVATVLGKLPEPWWSETWEMRRHFFMDDVDDKQQVVEIKSQSTTATTAGQHIGQVIFQQEEPKSLQEAINQGLFYESQRGPQGLRRAISNEEAEIFADLLAKILIYNPEKRLPAVDVLDHAWFKL